MSSGDPARRWSRPLLRPRFPHVFHQQEYTLHASHRFVLSLLSAKHIQADVADRGRHHRCRQAHAGRPHDLRSRRPLSHDGPVRGLHADPVARVAAARRHGRSRQDAGVCPCRQRWPGRTGGEVSGPFRRLCRGAADGQPRRRGQGGRAHPNQWQCQWLAAPHQRQWRLSRRAALPADFRGRREIGQADPAASGAEAGRSGFSG